MEGRKKKSYKPCSLEVNKRKANMLFQTLLLGTFSDRLPHADKPDYIFSHRPCFLTAKKGFGIKFMNTRLWYLSWLTICKTHIFNCQVF